MAEVKWIKITTDIFDDEKILLIESLPEADSIIVVWFKLLCLAGKQNNCGVFMMGNSMPYTDSMLATIFRRKESTIKLALKTFQEFGMIEIIDGVITIPNWNKHQSLDSYEKKKERDRLYQQERRQKQKLLAQKSSDSKTIQSSDIAISDIDIEEDKDIDIDKKNNKPVRHKYGEYKNVLLSDDDLDKLKAKFPIDWEERIENLSEGIELKGYKYKNHYLAICKWAKNDKPVKEQPKQQSDYDRFVGKLQQMYNEVEE
jgi:predicted phage replisome organizer